MNNLIVSNTNAVVCWYFVMPTDFVVPTVRLISQRSAVIVVWMIYLFSIVGLN